MIAIEQALHGGDFADCDLEQLYAARARLDSRIAELKSEPRKVVWAVENDLVRLKFFREGEYLRAAEALLVLAKQNVEANRDVNDRELHLMPLSVAESEYKQFAFEGE